MISVNLRNSYSEVSADPARFCAQVVSCMVFWVLLRFLVLIINNRYKTIKYDKKVSENNTNRDPLDAPYGDEQKIISLYNIVYHQSRLYFFL